MTGLYIASNVTSLVAQHQLQKNMTELGNIMTRLSTGLRINSGKDDPAGLIASELLKSDITATAMAIRNTQRANSIIAIADSALGQVSALLNDIRGLVNEAANTGAMSQDQIAANQLQVDASLDSIDRISKTTNYQGRNLLDGTMDFNLRGLDSSKIRNVNIYQANFGTADVVSIGVNVLKEAERARLYYDRAGVSTETVVEIGGFSGSEMFKFEAGATVTEMAAAINMVSDATGVHAIVGNEATHGQLMITSAGTNNDINLLSLIPGYEGGNYTIRYSAGNSEETTYTITPPMNGNPGIIDFFLKMDPHQAASVKYLDESYNGTYTYDLTDGDGDLIIQTNGIQIKQVEFVESSGDPGVAAVYDKATGKLQIQYSTGAADADFERALNAIAGITYYSGGEPTSGPGYYTPLDLRANNALDISATVPGSKFDNTDVVYVYDKTVASLPANEKVGDVALAYEDSAQNAAATIQWTSDDIQMRIVAKNIGSQYNDITIVFEQDNVNFDPGQVSAAYDSAFNVLHVRGQIDGTANSATYGSIKAAIEANSPFRVDITEISTGNSYALGEIVKTGLNTGSATGLTAHASGAYIKTGQVYGDIGTNNQTLFVRVGADSVTSNDVLAAFNDPAGTFASIAANFTASRSVDNDGTGKIFDTDYDNLANAAANPLPQTLVRVFAAALKGGNDGIKTAVTAQQLVDFINCDATLSKMFRADVALGNTGTGFLTLFDEAAYYGDPVSDNAIQFLGPKGSPDILFVIDGPNSELSISCQGALDSGCAVDDRPVASLQAQNANASFMVQALKSGGEYDNMVVRLIQLDNNHIYDASSGGRDDSYTQYVAGPSTAMAYCSINETGNETDAEIGKFIVYSTQGTDRYNNVEIVARLDVHQTEDAKAYYDESSKRLIVTVKDASVTQDVAMEAINQTGIFKAEFDYSYNTDKGSGIADFSTLFTGGKNAATIGNTGNTGGYNGTLNVYLAGTDASGTVVGVSADRVVAAIEGDKITSKLFSATTLGDGTGDIHFRRDNFREEIGSCGNPTTVPNLVTGIIGKSGNSNGYMVVHLATDANGYSITTAADLVNYMNTLDAIQTCGGISASLVRPPGVDNLNRTWTVDICGNVVMNQACEADYGKGLLQPTSERDVCDNIIYHPIPFFSFGENLVDGNANGTVVAVNGINASFQLFARQSGAEYNGTLFKYIQLGDPHEEMYADYDANRGQVTVYIHAGTTAGEVQQLIENSEGTKNLFYVKQAGDGLGVVTVFDDYMIMKGGQYDAGYRGGALMLGAADADPHKLIIESLEEGSRQYVTFRIIEGNMTVKDSNGKDATVDYGEDIHASVNGFATRSDGREVSVDSAMLKMSLILGDNVKAGDQINFTVEGGGAVFQVGPDVVSNQQLRIGIQSVNTSRLGGSAGYLYQLRTGNIADLFTNTKLADQIVKQAIQAVTTTRGRLGALQRSTLEPTLVALETSLEQLSAAEAEISNADFAQESSRLTRTQILVQSGARTLGLANQIPQYAASLLG